MKRFLKRIVVGLIVLFAAAQFLRPERTNPESDPLFSVRTQQDVPPKVLSVLDRACFDCHSNETRWPWYSNVTPINFLLVNHVTDGRRRLNFSEWGKMKPGRKLSALEDMADEVRGGGMPLKGYLMLHSEAKLSAEDVRLITDWAEAANGVSKE